MNNIPTKHVRIYADMHQELKLLAVKNKTSMTQLLNDMFTKMSDEELLSEIALNRI